MLNIIKNLKKNFYSRRMKKKWSDWEDNEFNIDDVKFIWGLKSSDCLTAKEPSFYTMNDIDIVYDRSSKLYSLSIETIYLFESHQAEIEYLEGLLKEFTAFMTKNNFSIKVDNILWTEHFNNIFFARSLPELYIKFKIFVEGFKIIYGKDNENNDS